MVGRLQTNCGAGVNFSDTSLSISTISQSDTPLRPKRRPVWIMSWRRRLGRKCKTKYKFVRLLLAECLGAFILTILLDMGWRTRLRLYCRTENEYVRLLVAEMMGAFILTTFGNGSVAQSVLTQEAAGTFLSVNWAYGFGVMFGVYASLNVSGAHLNPAVTLAMAMLGRLQWRKVPVYIVGQFLGTIASSAVVFGVYYDALNNFDGGNRTVVGPTATAGIFATYPKEYVSTWTGLGDQIVGTALLLICICAVVDKLNADPHPGLLPLVIGMIVVAIGLAFGSNCGYAINPARDLGPRLFTALAGWGGAVFSFRNYNWFWVPVVGPIIGGLLGALTYQIMVGTHWPDDVSYYVEQQESTQGHVNVGKCEDEDGDERPSRW